VGPAVREELKEGEVRTDGRATGPDPRDAPWPQYAEAVIELVIDGMHLVLTPVHDPSSDDAHAARTAAMTVAHHGTPIWVLTAGDPYPIALSSEENRAREQQLCAELDAEGIRHDPALGRSVDGTVSEVSRAVRGIDRATVLAIAARHGQLAVYEIADEIHCVDVASAVVVTRHLYLVLVAPADGRLAGPTGWWG